MIIISIDDQELSNLRLLCDEVFGIENRVACMVWEKSRKNDARLVSVGHDYVVIYANSLGYLNEQKAKWREEKPGAREIWGKYMELRDRYGSENDRIEEDLQEWFSQLPRSHPSKKWSRYKHVDQHGPWRDDNISWPGGGGPRYDVIHPITKRPCAVSERVWVFSKSETMQKIIDIGVIVFRGDHSEPPIRKSYIRAIEFEMEGTFETSGDTVSDNVTDEQYDDEELVNQVRGS